MWIYRLPNICITYRDVLGSWRSRINLVPRACDLREGMWGSGIIRFREESDWPWIPGFRQRIIPEPHIPSRGSQARGTRLTTGMSNVWWGPGPVTDGSRLGWGVLLIRHETFQSLINLFSPKLLASEGGGAYQFSAVTFELMYRNLLHFLVILVSGAHNEFLSARP